MPTQNLPKTGLAALRAHFKDDFISGFSVSLIALPLCIAIALASGFPPLAGLITAIVGGLFASRLAGSFVTISGPAAGLIVISLGAIESLGGGFAENHYAGYPHALGAILVAGIIVAIFGFMRFGKVGDFFPSSAVHGMLAAIGFIIMIKQIFTALGVASPPSNMEMIEQIGEIPVAFKTLNPFALSLSAITLAILIAHQYLKIKLIKLIPAPMWVLLIIIPVAQWMGKDHVAFVDMPDSIFGADGIQFPSFAKIGEGVFWVAVVSFALVSGIESLLSAKAVDNIDPYKRTANLDKDLIAMGSGSSLAAAIGGLPMISEIVRSSANINNGGKTQWANFYHGFLLLIYVIVLSSAIELIPKAALAGMLLFTGFRLAHPREFKHMAHLGKTELIVFLVTIIGVIATDILKGIAIGIATNYIILFINGVRLNELFNVKSDVDNNTLNLKGSLTFSNYLSLKKKINRLSQHEKVVLDFSSVRYIDHTVMHHLKTIQKQLKQKSVQLEFTQLNHLIPVSNDELSERKMGIERKPLKNKISQRQTELLSMVTEMNWNYTLKQDWNGAWDFYTITVRKKIISLENIITNISGPITFISGDITTQEGARMTEEFQYVTGLRIKGFKELPKFYMTEETVADKLANVVLGDDINFESHPKFSKNYILKGEDTQAIRSLFTPELLTFFENNPNLCLISNSVDLMLRSNYRLLKPEEVRELHAKGQELMAILEKQA